MYQALNFLFLPVHCFWIKHQGRGVHQHSASSKKHVLPRIHTWARGCKWTVGTNWTGWFHQILFFYRNLRLAESTRFISLLELCNVVATIKHRYIHRKTTNMACLLAALTHPGGSCLKNKLYVIWINYSVSEKRRISYSCNWTEKGGEAIS